MPILGIISSGISGNLFIPEGYTSYRDNFTTFTKLNMLTETTSTLTISVTNEAAGGASNSGVAAYRFGTTTDPKTANQKFSYSTNAVSNLANALPQARQYATGQSNSGTAAYVTGGATTGFAVRYRTIIKVPFSTDVPSQLGSSFTNMGNANMACSNNHIAGYTFGGESDTTGTGNWINKINYSNDAISALSATLPVNGRSTQAVSNDGTSAYTGNGNFLTNALYKFLYSNETISTMSATLVSPDLVFPASSYRFQTAGYFLGGFINNVEVSTIQKILYSNDTRTTISATLATADAEISHADHSNNGVI